MSENKKFSEVFKGIMHNGTYIFEECPYCNDTSTFRFTGNFSVGSCLSCNKVVTYEEFMKDMSNDLIYGLIVDSMNKPRAPEGLIDIGNYVALRANGLSIPSGFNLLDRMIGGFRGGELTILSGKKGEGKSTISGQLALNAINHGHKVFFYSGELSAKSFQNWLFLQAAGSRNINTYTDEYGETRHEIDREYAEPHIRHWLQGQMILYDNRVNKTSEVNTIVERARIAKDYYGCDLYFVDNLKTARFKKDSDRDHFRKQANFAADMLAFAQETNSHVILVAHPKKEDTGDSNDNVAGLSDITDIAHNVITIKRLSKDAKLEIGCDTILELSKNRAYGRLGKMKMNFEEDSKRFIMQDSSNVNIYNWEQEI